MKKKITKKQLKEIISKLKDRELFPEAVVNSAAYLQMVYNADVVLSVFETVKGNGTANVGSTPTLCSKKKKKIIEKDIFKDDVPVCPDCGSSIHWPHERGCPSMWNDNW